MERKKTHRFFFGLCGGLQLTHAHHVQLAYLVALLLRRPRLLDLELRDLVFQPARYRGT
jgi:hypothetical protein